MIYIRYSVLNIFLAFSAVCFALGGWWFWTALAVIVVLNTFIDELYGDELRTRDVRYTGLLLFQLFASLPLLLILSILFAAHFSAADRMGLDPLLMAVFGLDFAASRAATGPFQLLGGAVCLGLLYGAAGTNVAHELVHRTDRAFDYFMGRALLAFTFDTGFAIEHVYGHHRYVGTRKDPATARRGENVYGFFVRSTIGQLRGAFEIERERLKRKGIPDTLISNRAARGQGLSLIVWLMFFAFGGLYAALVFPVLALYGKFYLEAVNYIEHYGLIRNEGSRCESRHSWNSHRSLSSAFLYNLPRHSDHHMFARKPFWALDADAKAPQMPYGYLSMIVISLVPPLFHRIMHPLLADWDRDFASEGERAELRERGELLVAA